MGQLTDSCLVTVIGPTRRADLTLQSDVAVAELIPELVRLLDGESQAAWAPRRWSLLKVTGGPLDPERDLRQQAVRDGATLFLRDVSFPPPEPVVEDISEAVAMAVDARPGRWTVDAARALWLAAAAACVTGAAGLCTAAPDGLPRATLGLGAGLLLVVAAAVLQAARQPLAAAVLALAAASLWAVGGDGAAGLAGGSLAGALIGVSAGVAVGALTACLAAPLARPPATAACVVALPLGAVAAAGAALSAAPAGEAAVLAVAWLALADLMPPLASGLAGLPAREAGPPAPAAALRAQVDRGHRWLAWLLAGSGLGLTGALVVLALGSSPAGRALCAAAALAAGLRARRQRFAPQVLALAVPALAGALALALVLPGSLRVAGGSGMVTGAGLLLVAAAVALWLALDAGSLDRPSPRRRRAFEVLEPVANLALVPLVAGALGLFGAVAQQAHRLG